MKIGSFQLLCGVCNVPREVQMLSTEVTPEGASKIAYRCLHAMETQFEEYIPKPK